MSTDQAVNVPMDARDGSVRSVVWRDIFPCVLLVRALRISFRFSVLLAAVVGYLLMALGGWFIGEILFAGVEDPLVDQWRRTSYGTTWSEGTHLARVFEATGETQREGRVALGAGTAGNAADGERLPSPAAAEPWPRSIWDDAAQAPANAWWHLAGPVIHLFHPQLSPTALGYLLLCCAWNVAVWALCGGVISRTAALAYTRQESLGIVKGVSHAFLWYPAHALAPLLAAAAILLVAMPLVVAGTLMRIQPLALVAGGMWFAVLLIGLLLALLSIGLIVGWPLLWAAVAVEQSDAFDAVSRSYAYVFQRPLHLAGYVVGLVALAVAGSSAFHLLAGATVAAADWAVAWGSGAQTLQLLQGDAPGEVLKDGKVAAQPSRSMEWAAGGRRFWIRAVAALVAAYPIGFLWSAAVGIYLLLRLHVDGAQTDEIAGDELDLLPELPSLKPHESGVPEVERPSTA